MRRFLALGCCAAYLALGFVVGAAHVHRSADHHEQTGGLHLDHAHLETAGNHGAQDHHRHDSHDGDARVDARHVGHHDGDALYLSATTLRSSDAGDRVMPATVSAGPTFGPSVASSNRRHDLSGPRRGPPWKESPRTRAPPA